MKNFDEKLKGRLKNQEHHTNTYTKYYLLIDKSLACYEGHENT